MPVRAATLPIVGAPGAWRPAVALALTMLLGGCQAQSLSGPRPGLAAHAAHQSRDSATAAGSSAAAAATVRPAGARLRINLAALYGQRHLQYAPATPKLKIDITGPDLTTPFEEDADVGPAGQTLEIDQVPTGHYRVISVRGLDITGHLVAGTTLEAATTLGPGLTTVNLSRASTLVANVVTDLMDTDQTSGTQVLQQVDLAALDAAVTGYTRSLHAPDPALMDAGAIASAIYHADGVPPAAPDPAFLHASGSVIVRPQGWPPNASATLSLDDPLSQPMVLDDDGAHVLGPVAPGKWTLTVTPNTPGLLPVTLTATVTSGASVEIPVSFGTGQAQTSMPEPIGAAMYGVLPIVNGEALFTLGGVASGAGNVSLGGQQLDQQRVWSPSSSVEKGLVDPGLAIQDGRLYAFGGHDTDGPTGNVQRFDPATPDRVGVIGALPNDRTGWGLSAGLIGPYIYVTGGTDARAASGKTLAFDANAAQWRADALPDLPVPRIDMASAVVEGKLYVFGGILPGQASKTYDVADDWIAVSDSTALTPGDKAVWTALAPMPTPRSGAAAIAVSGQIWVIGGATTHGAPTGAVEVFNPANSSWSARPPLQVPRAFPAVGLLNEKIVVAGGVAGSSPLEDTPVADVEELTP